MRASCHHDSVCRVEAGSNTSTVTLRVVGGGEKGSLRFETKYGHEPQETRTRERLRWKRTASCTNDRPVLSSERASHRKQDRNCQTIIHIWSCAPDEVRHQDLLTDWLTDWPTDRKSQYDFDLITSRGSLESETAKCGHESHGTQTWECLRWWRPAALVNDRPILSSEGLLRKDYDRKCSVEKILIVSLKELVAKTRWMAVNRKS
jgi:hypothetical protein